MCGHNLVKCVNLTFKQDSWNYYHQNLMCVANWWALWGVWADFEKEIRYTDIINIKWLLAISEYSEKKSLEEHQKKLDFLKQCCEACEPCIESIRKNFFYNLYSNLFQHWCPVSQVRVSILGNKLRIKQISKQNIKNSLSEVCEPFWEGHRCFTYKI